SPTASNSTGGSIHARLPGPDPPPSSRRPIHAPESAVAGIHQLHRLRGPSIAIAPANSASGTTTPHAPKRQPASSDSATPAGTMTHSAAHGGGDCAAPSSNSATIRPVRHHEGYA